MVVSLGLVRLGAVHEHIKNHNFFCMHTHFLDLSVEVHATIKNLTNNLICNLAAKFHANFWVAIFPFLQKWHHVYLWRAYTKAEVSLHIGYYLGFQPHPVQERMIPYTNFKI